MNQPRKSVARSADFSARVLDLYAQRPFVRAVSRALGVRTDRVSEVLKASGVTFSNDPFPEQHKKRIREFYETTPADEFDLSRLAAELGHPRSSLSMIAKRMGLTKRGRPHSEAARKETGRKARARLQLKGHPKGMLGKKHTPEVLEVMSIASKRMWATWKTFNVGLMEPHAREKNRERLLVARTFVKTPFSRTRGGKREDIGPIYFRSSWEANYARYLNLLKKMGVVEDWKYEPETFWFPDIKRGVCSYLPDFRVKYKGDEIPEYLEIKGWVVAKDRTKWRRMAKYHPHIKLVIVGEKQYAALKRKWSSAIPMWESVKGGGRKLGPRKPFVSLGEAAARVLAGLEKSQNQKKEDAA